MRSKQVEQRVMSIDEGQTQETMAAEESKKPMSKQEVSSMGMKQTQIMSDRMSLKERALSRK